MARIGAILILAALSVFGATNSYELQAQVERKFGIREYAETTYSYFEIEPSGAKTLRWRRKEGGKYGRHWIFPCAGWCSASRSVGPAPRQETHEVEILAKSFGGKTRTQSLGR